jgi:diguanylate cyclase (GGDEF)-like protein
LPNRLCFDSDWRKRFVPEAHIAVISLDLDKFKLVNDVHGHDGGDKALKKMATIGAEVFRHPDGNLFRFGGEEFLALIFADKPEVTKMVEYFRQTLENRAAKELAAEGMELKWLDPAGSGEFVPRKLTASIGVAYWPEHGATIEEVIKASDEAAYMAKEQGRNRIVYYEPSVRTAPAEIPPAPAPAPAPKSKPVAKAKKATKKEQAQVVPVSPESEPEIPEGSILTVDDLLAADVPGRETK